MADLLTGGFNTELSPDAAHTAIDAAMWEEFTRLQQPENLIADDSWFFKQGNTVGNAFIVDADSGVGEFEETNELEEINNTDSWVGNQKIRISKKYTKQIPISSEAFKADQIGKREQIGKAVGEKARQTKDKTAILRTYGDAFSATYDSCDDGVALASNSHVTLRGATVDNLETGGMSPANLWTAVNSLGQQKGQDGFLGSHVFEGLVVPMYGYKETKEVLDSELRAQTAENDVNIFNTIYGTVRVRQSVFLNSAYNWDATYNNNTYHLLGRNHQIARKVFYGLSSEMVEPKYSGNDAWNLRWAYNEMAYPGTWTGYLGSNGTT